MRLYIDPCWEIPEEIDRGDGETTSSGELASLLS